MQSILTNQSSDKFMLRFPDNMRDSIRRMAAAEGRSMNAQIVKLLEPHVRPHEKVRRQLEHMQTKERAS